MPESNKAAPNPARRTVITGALALLGAAAAGLGWTGFRFLFPNTTPPEQHRVRLDKASSYPLDQADNRHKKTLNLFILRTKISCIALSANCTHLGCSIEWIPQERFFKCPCHGSGFSMDGMNMEGPAPRALERIQLEMDSQGFLVADLSQKFLFEKGEWKNPRASVTL